MNEDGNQSGEPTAAELESQLSAMVDDAGYDDADESSTPEAPDAAQEAAPPDFWGQTLPDDENLPKPYRGTSRTW